MAGHSQFKNIMHRKNAQDAKRAKLFTKILREITVSAKNNPDPEHNPRLRAAMISARSTNIPKDRIQTAISKASNPADNTNYEEIRYEGYGPGGVALIVEALTDNRNRTASEVRAAFTKFGGQLAETGSVGFMFKRVGMIIYPASEKSADSFLEATIEAGGNDCVSDDSYHEITCEPEALNEVREILDHKFGTPDSVAITWKPNNIQIVSDEEGEKIIRLMDALEECDDVQNVVGNYEFSYELMNKLKNA